MRRIVTSGLPGRTGARRLAMPLPLLAAAGVLTGCQTASGQTAGLCAMTKAFDHQETAATRKPVFTGRIARTGTFVFFRSKLWVNTDGAATSYHPDDPTGAKGLAINHIANGINAYTYYRSARDRGRRYSVKQQAALMRLFRRARKIGWLAPNGPRIDWYGVAAKGARGATPCPQSSFDPCIVPSGRYKGYFVSATALNAAARHGRCSPESYVDSLTVPAIVIPGSKAFRALGARLGDIVAVRYRRSGKVVFAVVGDTGPPDRLGEGTVALARSLRKTPPPIPRSYRQSIALKIDAGVDTLIFKGSRIGWPYTVARIDAAGRRLLAAFGGVRRLRACGGAAEQ